MLDNLLESSGHAHAHAHPSQYKLGKCQQEAKRTHPSKDDSECRCIISPTGGYCERILGIMHLDIPMEIETEAKGSTNLDLSMMEYEELTDGKSRF